MRVLFEAMSVAEIIKELPKLTAEERSAILRRLRELEPRDETQFLHEAADSMFQDMDKGEVKGVRRKAR
jgi:hypothetical protein